ncbi:sulfate ABC transporter substrate-binding protein [Paenibacillus albiflavus]|uniref:Sulfate ABC transporter substrate-binding protein n=1 Tax=Paenibacillus albiflavus TaxID=2545760 RepID=A0A4R4EN39_9BACL|nr:sulfate ABC transporter substrate-binding protein [Paenibacillus albiflavus]
MLAIRNRKQSISSVVRYKLIISLLLIFGITACGSNSTDSPKSVELIHVSFDATRELFDDMNKVFADEWLAKTGEEVLIRQSHGGSGKQARTVNDGLQADVVSLALSYDMDRVKSAGLIDPNWRTRMSSGPSPFTSTIVFLVREGNPKQIHDWNDLVKPGVSVITPNPKTSGGARWNYMGAWGYALQAFDQNEDKAKEFVTALYKNVPILGSGARDSMTTFLEQDIGDVLIAWESEALFATNEPGRHVEIVTPSISVSADPVMSVVDQVVDHKGTRAAAEAYMKFMYTEEGQTIAAQHYFRPQMQSVADKYADQFPKIKLFSLDDPAYGGWDKVQKKHFADGGIFDEIYQH